MSARGAPLNYGVRTFDLSQERQNERVPAHADELSVLRADDSVDLRIGSPNAAAIPLRRLESIAIPNDVENLYLSNSSGSGNLILLFGLDDVRGDVGSAEVEGTVDIQDRAAREIGKARIQDSGGVLIDPATDNSLTSVQPRSVDGTSQITASDSGTGSANAAELQLGDVRKDVDFYVSTSGAATLTVEVSADGATWHEFDTVDYAAAAEEIEQYQTTFGEIRAYLDQNRTEIEAVSRGA